MKNYSSCLYLGWLSVGINNGTERATAEMWKATMQGGEVGRQAERCLYCHPDQRGPLTGPARNALWAPLVLHPPYPEPVVLSQACRKSAWLSSESLVQWSSGAGCLVDADATGSDIRSGMYVCLSSSLSIIASLSSLLMGSHHLYIQCLSLSLLCCTDSASVWIVNK